jgi:hypothetical protein
MKPGVLFNERLEAPPGFEPGVEVLQFGRRPFGLFRDLATFTFLEQFIDFASVARFASFGQFA